MASLMRARRPQLVMKLTGEEHTTHWSRNSFNCSLPSVALQGLTAYYIADTGLTCTICLSSHTKHVPVNVNHFLQCFAVHELVSAFITVSQPWTCCAMGL